MIYLDNAATTQTDEAVRQAMMPYLDSNYGNASAAYELGGKSKKALAQARKIIADSLRVSADEIYFTSGGTESDNWVLKGVAEAYQDKGRHIITSAIEHHAVLHSCEHLEKQGYEVTYLPVDELGRIRPEQLERAIRPDTILISIMYANNEIGTLQPIDKVGRIAKKHDILFHTDAVQAYGHIPIYPKELGIHLLSASAHKFYGPKGVGFLYVRDGIQLPSYMDGGAQEKKKRAGTENVAGIVGMGTAAQLAMDTMQKRAKEETRLRDMLIQDILQRVPYVRLNGCRRERLPNNASFCFQFVDGGSILVLLDMKEICASAGSACTTGSGTPSHVLTALGIPDELAYGSLRLTLGKDTTEEDIRTAADAVVEAVEELRKKSPLYEDFVKRGRTLTEEKKADILR